MTFSIDNIMIYVYTMIIYANRRNYNEKISSQNKKTVLEKHVNS
jgi:hypothetical protein